ncbi:hypothetical protein QJS66_03955 [Kocuria rhizophila]|nr:hypothetical protein QJS66_03955 [Kocuria rhizophila]
MSCQCRTASSHPAHPGHRGGALRPDLVGLAGPCAAPSNVAEVTPAPRDLMSRPPQGGRDVRGHHLHRPAARARCAATAWGWHERRGRGGPGRRLHQPPAPPDVFHPAATCAPCPTTSRDGGQVRGA